MMVEFLAGDETALVFSAGLGEAAAAPCGLPGRTPGLAAGALGEGDGLAVGAGLDFGAGLALGKGLDFAFGAGLADFGAGFLGFIVFWAMGMVG
jgi:hypothetical protein